MQQKQIETRRAVKKRLPKRLRNETQKSRNFQNMISKSEGYDRKIDDLGKFNSEYQLPQYSKTTARKAVTFEMSSLL